jgi:hypothetical protein
MKVKGYIKMSLLNKTTIETIYPNRELREKINKHLENYTYTELVNICMLMGIDL